MTMLPRAKRSAISRTHGRRVYLLFTTIVSLLYGIILANLPLLAFKDRDNYFRYAQSSGATFDRYQSEGIRTLLFNEPLWLVLNDVLGRFLPAEQVLWLVICAPAAVVAFIVLRRGPNRLLYLAFLLIVPYVIKNHIIHLRQGVAIALFFTALQVKYRPVRYLLLALTPFIHSSFFIVLAIYIFSQAARKLFKSAVISVIVSALASLISLAFFVRIASWSGARQGESLESSDAAVSGVGFVLWLCVAILLMSAGRDRVRENLFPITMTVFYLSAYFVAEHAGRIFESGILAVLLAGAYLERSRYRLIFLAIFLYTAMTYASRWGSPGLGWGI